MIEGDVVRVVLSVGEIVAVLAVAVGVLLVAGLGWALIVGGVLAVLAIERQPPVAPRSPAKTVRR